MGGWNNFWRMENRRNVTLIHKRKELNIMHGQSGSA